MNKSSNKSQAKRASSLTILVEVHVGSGSRRSLVHQLGSLAPALGALHAFGRAATHDCVSSGSKTVIMRRAIAGPDKQPQCPGQNCKAWSMTVTGPHHHQREETPEHTDGSASLLGPICDEGCAIASPSSRQWQHGSMTHTMATVPGV